MRDPGPGGAAALAGSAPATDRARLAALDARERLVVEDDELTGTRLKYYARAADVAYWTDLWRAQGELSYRRERRGHLPHQLRATFAKWVKPGARVLEAGCGLARFTVAADALGYRAEGLDWSADTIEHLGRLFPSLPWHVGDVRQLQFERESFDALYSPGVCEHFEEGPAAVLEESRRVLRRGGVAVVSTPCFNGWLRRHASRLGEATASLSSPFYQYAFTEEGMARLLTRLGFEVLQIHPYAALETFTRYGGWRVPSRVKAGLAFAMDHLPGTRRWGSTCIWVARRC
ncbi:MAG TPA: class I SAM-dependent methyltransferase [Vicinamibacterales bacterium]|nr:class I SAM-dependent methyltransferase [Vicinamibacterales bacterium]